MRVRRASQNATPKSGRGKGNRKGTVLADPTLEAKQPTVDADAKTAGTSALAAAPAGKPGCTISAADAFTPKIVRARRDEPLELPRGLDACERARRLRRGRSRARYLELAEDAERGPRRRTRDLTACARLQRNEPIRQPRACPRICCGVQVRGIIKQEGTLCCPNRNCPPNG
jgi:hypothetical protein